ncbi:hypothetical protein L1987_30437 [Smallanthus sonchifolius]|uniref:Uncharacterized protein n=1 Tax=Smallanthus sonchifolius TaxID=185202 RepID=A0ACB9I3F7_9ASTR|nr:hypothetical protein L1987_30437 [Smallanthus sonchifolius]
MARRVEYKHNQVALLDPNISEAVKFQGIIGFLNRSRLHVALSADPYISLVYIQQFWDTVHQDTDVEPHVLRATVNNTKIAISEETIRAALDLGGNAEDPLSYPGTLILGCFQRMGYRGKQNDTQARKGGLVSEWRYFMHVIIQCISPRKAGTDGLKMALQTAMVALTLNKRFNFPLYFYQEMVMQINPAEGQGFLMYPRFIQMILNHLIPELPQHPIRLTLTPMSKRIFTDYTKVKQQNAALIPVNTPLFGHLINPDYVAPPNDNWFHPDEIAHAQGFNIQQQPAQQQIPVQQVEIPIHEPVQEEVVHAHEHDLGMNMDDFVDDAVNSPIHEAEGNVVTDDESSSNSSDTILHVNESTESDESRDFSSNHYERLAAIPLANAGKRIKSHAREESLFGILLPVQYMEKDPWLMRGVEDANFVASLIITPPRSKDTSPVTTPVPPVNPTTASPSIPQSSAGPSKPSDSERITFLESQVLSLQTQVNTLVSTDSQWQLVIQTQAQQIADMQALVTKIVQRLDAQGELRIPDTCHTESIQRCDDEDNDPAGNIEGNKDTSGTNKEEILLLELFQDSEEEEAEKIACLDDIDDLFNEMEDDIVTYEGCDGLKVPYNFIQDDFIPEFTYEGVTDSMDSVEDVILPEDTADSKIDIDDETIQSNKDAESETTHTESPKVNEEPVMYRDTGMTREQWREVVNSWMKVLPKSPVQPAQKEKYVNKEQCVGRMISWFYDDESKLFAIKRSDGVQYLKPRIKYFNTLPRCEINGLASKPLINRSKIGLADVIENLIKKEGSSGKYKYKPVCAIHKIPLKKIPQDFLGNMKWWYVDVNTGEDKDNKVIVCFYDAMNLINFSKKDQRMLRKNEIMFTDAWREKGLQYKRVLEIWSAC